MRGVSLIAPHHRHFRHLRARRCLSRSSVGLAAAPVEGLPGLSFSGCGWLTSFHLGVTKELTDQGRLTASTKLYGASGGSLAAVVSACDLDPDRMLRLQLDLFDHSVKHGFFFKLSEVLLERLEATLPPDAHTMCTDRVSIAILRVWPNPSPTAILIDQFEDRNDLIRAIHASCFVPGYLEAALTTDWRGMAVVDGGLVDMVPVAPPGVTKVNPFSFHPKLFDGATAGISPRLLGKGFTPSTAQLCRWAFRPPTQDSIRYMYDCGQAAAERWIAAQPQHN